MAMVKCKECGEKISSKASSCPSCGAPIKKKRSGCGILIIAVFVLFLIGVLLPDNKPAPSSNNASSQDPKVEASRTSYIGHIECTLSNGSAREAAIRDALTHLKEVSEIVWIEIDRNTVYLGFSERFVDLSIVTKGVALRANEAISFGAHAWAVDAKHRGWRAGDGSYWFEATARNGQIGN